VHAQPKDDRNTQAKAGVEDDRNERAHRVEAAADWGPLKRQCDEAEDQKRQRAEHHAAEPSPEETREPGLE
jgi:hypothetical protein